MQEIVLSLGHLEGTFSTSYTHSDVSKSDLSLVSTNHQHISVL